VLIATSFYVVQKSCHVRLAGDLAPWFVVLGYNFFILIAGTGYLLGVTQSKEYAEPEWYADLWLTIVWVVYLLVFLVTIIKRKEPHIFVANWFYLAFIVTIAVLHLGNNPALPVSVFGSKSYVAWGGIQDAMFQWWYGHNAVGFFLTTGFLGMMYYFVPKQANRPVYSYRLSIVHFWALIAVYMWAGPHHLQYTALPDWAQSVGMVFSLILLAPSWGGAMNGILTLSGVWHKLRTDPILKFLIVAISFYMIATFEGPMMSIKTVNSLSHYTDWTIGHVHAGALGWVAMISIGSIYALLPRLFGVKAMFSTRWIDLHFWIHTLGLVFYIAAMWIAGVMQGLMWRATNADGTLTYSFVEALNATYPYYLVRLGGGLVVLAGMGLMAWNTWKTFATAPSRAPQPVLIPDVADARA
jgi:cytochrome c oxidase cbb3-type subunit 1